MQLLHTKNKNNKKRAQKQIKSVKFLNLRFPFRKKHNLATHQPQVRREGSHSQPAGQEREETRWQLERGKSPATPLAGVWEKGNNVSAHALSLQSKMEPKWRLEPANRGRRPPDDCSFIHSYILRQDAHYGHTGSLLFAADSLLLCAIDLPPWSRLWVPPFCSALDGWKWAKVAREIYCASLLDNAIAGSL